MFSIGISVDEQVISRFPNRVVVLLDNGIDSSLTGSARCRLGTDYSYNLSPGQIIAILVHFGSSCRRGDRLKEKMDSATDLDSLAAVAAQIGDDESESIAAAAAVPVTTGKRARKASAVEMAQRKLDEKQRALHDAEASILLVETKGALATKAEKKKAARKILISQI